MPSYALAHYELARALNQKGLKDEAGAEYGRAAELDPHLVSTRYAKIENLCYGFQASTRIEHHILGNTNSRDIRGIR